MASPAGPVRKKRHFKAVQLDVTQPQPEPQPEPIRVAPVPAAAPSMQLVLHASPFDSPLALCLALTATPLHALCSPVPRPSRRSTRAVPSLCTRFHAPPLTRNPRPFHSPAHASRPAKLLAAVVVDPHVRTSKYMCYVSSSPGVRAIRHASTLHIGQCCLVPPSHQSQPTYCWTNYARRTQLLRRKYSIDLVFNVQRAHSLSSTSCSLHPRSTSRRSARRRPYKVPHAPGVKAMGNERMYCMPVCMHALFIVSASLLTEPTP